MSDSELEILQRVTFWIKKKSQKKSIKKRSDYAILIIFKDQTLKYGNSSFSEVIVIAAQEFIR